MSLAHSGWLAATAAALLLLAVPARAQIAGVPVKAGSGPLTDLSDNVSAGSRPVHEPGVSSLRDASRHSLSDGAVSDSTTPSVRSGSVSDATVGSVHSDNRARRFAPIPVYGNAENPLTETAPDLSDLENSIAGLEPLPAETEIEPTDFADLEAAEAAANPPPTLSPQ